MALLYGNLHVTGTLQAGEILGQREVKQITGDGVNKVFFLTHTLGVKEVQVSAFTFDWRLCLARTVLQSIGNFVVTFADPPGLNEIFNIVVTK